MFEDDEQVKYCEAIVEEARSQLETKVSHCGLIASWWTTQPKNHLISVVHDVGLSTYYNMIKWLPILVHHVYGWSVCGVVGKYVCN